MTALLLIIAGAVLLGGWIFYRETRRAPLVPDREQSGQPMKAWHTGIKIDRRTDYTKNSGEADPLMEKLRQEELRQKPQERRN